MVVFLSFLHSYAFCIEQFCEVKVTL